MRLSVGIILVFAFTSVATAQKQPEGTRGVDWNEDTIEIGGNAEIEINAEVNTTSTDNDASSTVALFIDGREVARNGGLGPNHKLSFKFAENGVHTLQVRCSNHRADADTCAFTATEVKPHKVFGEKK